MMFQKLVTKRLLPILMCVVILCSLVGCASKAEKDAYYNGVAAFSQGRYEEAARYLVQANDYEDSWEKLLEIYYAAVSAFENGDVDSAEALFDILVLNKRTVNDAAGYQAVIDAFNKLLANKNVEEFLKTVNKYFALSGVKDLREEILEKCYDKTYILMFEEIAYNDGSSYRKSKDYNCKYEHSGKHYDYYSYIGSDVRLTTLEDDFADYGDYLESIGAEKERSGDSEMRYTLTQKVDGNKDVEIRIYIDDIHAYVPMVSVFVDFD